MSGNVNKDWWAPLRVGLFTDKKHRSRMGQAIWLYGYLHSYADRKTGRLVRNCGTIAAEIGAEVKTVQRWMRLLEKQKYIQLRRLPHGFSIQIEKFRPIGREERLDNLEVVNGQSCDSDKTVCDSSDKNVDHETISKQKPKDPRTDKPEGLKESIKESIKDIYRIFEYWNSQKIIEHRELEMFSPDIKFRLNHYSPEEIIQAIKNYKDILDSPEHFFSHEWTLSEFLSRKSGMDKFLDREKAFKNFQKSSKGNGSGFRSQAEINSSSNHRAVV